MNAAASHWIPLEAIRPLIDGEPYLIVGLLACAEWIGYRLLQRGLSERRHANLRLRFAGLLTRYAASAGMAAIFHLLEAEAFVFDEPMASLTRRLPAYFALLALGAGAMAIIQLAKIAVYQFLFWRNMKSGVPRLIVNLFTMIFSLLVWTWIFNHVFGVRLVKVGSNQLQVIQVLQTAAAIDLQGAFGIVQLAAATGPTTVKEKLAQRAAVALVEALRQAGAEAEVIAPATEAQAA